MKRRYWIECDRYGCVVTDEDGNDYGLYDGDNCVADAQQHADELEETHDERWGEED